MSSQNADIPEQSAPTPVGEDSRPEWPPIPDDRPVAASTGRTDADAAIATDADGDDDDPAGSDEEVEERFLTFHDLFEQGNSIVTVIPAEDRDPRYGDETRVAIFEGTKNGRTEYYKVVHASSVDI